MISLREKRIEAGLTQEKLANACDCGRTAIVEIELGNNLPSWKLAQRIAKVIGGFDWWELFPDSESEVN